MSVGTFQIAVLDANDNIAGVFARTTRVSCPRVGEEVAVNGVIYRVVRVLHEDDPDDRTVRRYVNTRVFVRDARARLPRLRAARVLPLSRTTKG
jgi:hypothetical protein